MGSELAAAIAMLIGGSLLLSGFLFSIGLLSVFCIALASVLIRKINTSCNCFGSSDKPVAVFDIVRNFGFILCGLVGCGTLIFGRGETGALGALGWGLAGIVAVVFVVILVQMGEIIQLFR